MAADLPILRTEKMAAGGDAIARLDDGKVVFVASALPGELVEVSLTAERRDFARGRVVGVREPSPHRVAPPCPSLAQGCGGCPWQFVEPSAQLALKGDIVREALARTGGLADADVRVGGAVPPWAYRTTMRLAVDLDGRPGLRMPASHDVVALADCMVAHPRLASLLGDLRVRGAGEVTLRIGVAGGEATALADRAGARIEGLPPHVAVGPRAVVHEEVAGARLRVSAASFFQSGPAAAELLVAAVREARGPLPDGAVLLDAYGGVGLFAATVSTGPVVLVESSRSACADARVNLGSRAEVSCTPFERWSPRKVDVAVADPARAGLGKAGVAVLHATEAATVVLVSCDPVAMARDAALLGQRGYRHVVSTVLDLFPQTPHVEVVTRFERG